MGSHRKDLPASPFFHPPIHLYTCACVHVRSTPLCTVTQNVCGTHSPSIHATCCSLVPCANPQVKFWLTPLTAWGMSRRAIHPLLPPETQKEHACWCLVMDAHSLQAIRSTSSTHPFIVLVQLTRGQQPARESYKRPHCVSFLQRSLLCFSVHPVELHDNLSEGSPNVIHHLQCLK